MSRHRDSLYSYGGRGRRYSPKTFLIELAIFLAFVLILILLMFLNR